MKKKLLLSLLCGVLVLGIATGCGDKENNSNNENNNNNTNQETTKGSSIKDIRVSLSNIIALTNNGELYVYGTDNYGELGVGDSSSTVSKPTKVASNVKSFYGSGSQTYYIDNNDDLYMAGLRYTGGMQETFEKVTSNAKEVASAINCAVVMDKDGNVLVRGPKNGYCGFTQVYEEFTNVGSNAKDVLVHQHSSGYLSNSNELYLKTKNGDSYVKTLENVKEISDTYVLLNNGEVYNIGYDGAFTKLDDNVSDINDSFYMKNDGTVYNVNKTKINAEVSSVDDILYDGVSFSNEIIVYVNKDNKIVLHSTNGDNTIDNNLDSFKQILNFIK